jgi:hypothetical protein
MSRPRIARGFIELENAGYTPRGIVFDALSTEFPMCGSSESLVADWRERAFADCRFVEGAADVVAAARRAGYRTGSSRTASLNFNARS